MRCQNNGILNSRAEGLLWLNVTGHSRLVARIREGGYDGV